MLLRQMSYSKDENVGFGANLRLDSNSFFICVSRSSLQPSMGALETFDDFNDKGDGVSNSA